jgi:hypothetical protein
MKRIHAKEGCAFTRRSRTRPQPCTQPERQIPQYYILVHVFWRPIGSGEGFKFTNLYIFEFKLAQFAI